MSDAAFGVALKIFNKKRANIVGCLHAAIDAYFSEKTHEIIENYNKCGFTLHTADTASGVDTALVITGFKDLSEIQCFLVGRQHASRE